MPPRPRRAPDFPPVALTDRELRYVAGLLDGVGTLRNFVRGNGQEVVRLTVGNLREDQVLLLREGFRVGSRRGTVSATGRGLTWAVEGRWACLHVAKAVMPYFVLQGSPLRRAFVKLLIAATEAPLTGVERP